MKKLFTIFLLILLPALAGADTVEIDGIYYNLFEINKAAEITKPQYPNTYSGEIVIPETVTYEGTEYSVTSISKEAFSACRELISVIIPNSVTHIGERAFQECILLSSVNFPDHLSSIENYAFSYCSGLISLTIPNNIRSIGQQAFEGCSQLSTLTIGTRVSFIDDSAFNSCSGLETIKVEDGNPTFDSRNNCNAIIETKSNNLVLGCKNTIIPNTVTIINHWAFDSCVGLTSLAIPNSVTDIADQAFCGCINLSSITIPKSVTFISSCAFDYCSRLATIVVEEGNPVYDSRDNCNAIIETESNTLIAGCLNTVIPSSVTFIGRDSFCGRGIISVTIPNSVTSIGSSAFRLCENLDSVIIGDGVKTIEGGAFTYCCSLFSVSIPDAVNSIGEIAFLGCNELTSVIIGKDITYIGGSAFCECKRLADFYCHAKELPETGIFAGNDDIFSSSISKAILHVPASSIETYKSSEHWNKFKEIVALEDEIKITSAGQTTWCSAYDLDFTDIEGLKAYTATGYHRTKGTIWLTRVKEVPAGEGILLIGDEGEYKIPHKSTTAYYANLMVGTVKAITLNETDGEYTNYYLSNGSFGIGFYKVNGSVDLKANRAYLPLLKSTTSSSRGFIGLDFDDGEEGTTGISEAPQRLAEKDVYYNLQGQRVDNPGKGLYIRNGKKVIIR